MNRKQGLELFNLFFRLPNENFWPGINYLVPTSEGKALDLLKMSDEDIISDEASKELREIITTKHGKELLAYILANNLNSRRVYGFMIIVWRIHISKELKDSLSESDYEEIFDFREFIQSIFKSYSPTLSSREFGSGCTFSNIMGFYEVFLGLLQDKDLADILKMKELLVQAKSTKKFYAEYLKERDKALESLAGTHEFDGETLWQEQASADTNLLIQKMQVMQEKLSLTLGMPQNHPVAEPPNLEFWEQVALAVPALMRKSTGIEGAYVNLCKGTRAFKGSLKAHIKAELTKKGVSALPIDGLFPTAKTLHAKVWRTDGEQYGKTAFKDT